MVYIQVSTDFHSDIHVYQGLKYAKEANWPKGSSLNPALSWRTTKWANNCTPRGFNV